MWAQVCYFHFFFHSLYQHSVVVPSFATVKLILQSSARLVGVLYNKPSCLPKRCIRPRTRAITIKVRVWVRVCVWKCVPLAAWQRLGWPGRAHDGVERGFYKRSSTWCCIYKCCSEGIRLIQCTVLYIYMAEKRIFVYCVYSMVLLKDVC